MSEEKPEDDKAEAPEEAGENKTPDIDGENADGAEAGEDFDEDEGAGEDIRVTKGRRIALIAVALVVIVLGGGGAAYTLGLFDSLLGIQSTSKIATIDLGVPVRHELPMIKADLKTGECRSPLLRTLIVVEISSKDLPRLEAMHLRINDAISTYLRDFERQDMVGKKGSDKFRMASANIINNLIVLARIQAVIFKEFIIQ